MDSMKVPKVSCTMLTANRQKYVPLAISNFLNQDYPSLELVIVDDGYESVRDLIPVDSRIKYIFSNPIGSIGAKRNYACDKSSGEIIMHWDDDDWYAPDWVSKQVAYLVNSGADICGIEHVHFYSPITDTFWQGTSLNRNKGYRIQWLSGATLAFWKSYWEKHPFEHLNMREDDGFITKHDAKVFAHDYIDGFVALLHPKNTTTKYFEHSKGKAK